MPDCTVSFLQKAVVAVEIESKESIYGYHKNHKIPFLRITVALQKLIAPSRRLLEQGFTCPGFNQLNHRTFESNIDFEVSSSTTMKLEIIIH